MIKYTILAVSALILVLTGSLSSSAAEAAKRKAEAADVTAITAAIKSGLTKEPVESVYIDKIVGDYAAAIVSVKDGDGGIAYLRKSGSDWKLLKYDASVTEGALVDLGVPQDIARQMTE
jgi:hypothetical protein